MIFPELPAAADRLREKKPLVHCITNYVTATDTANMLLAAGASPIMADDMTESAEITAQADALLINLGTPSAARVEAMLRSACAANEKGIPIVLDPVGAGASSFRRQALARLFSAADITILRGNLSEISALCDIPCGAHGVDCEGDSGAMSAAVAAAKRFGCACVVTGKTDAVADCDNRLVINNGTQLLKQITGAGCMTSALTAAYSAVAVPLCAAILGAATMGILGEIAQEKSADSGLGRFHEELFNAAGKLNSTILSERICYEKG